MPPPVRDRYGAGRVVVAGTLASMAGMYFMWAARSGFDLLVGGVLMGIGVSGTGLNALVGAAGRAAPPEKRTGAIAALGMASGIGGFYITSAKGGAHVKGGAVGL